MNNNLPFGEDVIEIHLIKKQNPAFIAGFCFLSLLI